MGDVLSGLAVGVAYGVVAAAIAVASRATRTLHLAIGPAVVLGALTHLVLVAEGGTPGPLALLAGLVVGAVASATIEPLVLRRVEGQTAAIVGIFVVGGVLVAGAARTLGARTVRPDPLVDLGWLVTHVESRAGAVDAIVVGVPLAVALTWLLHRTAWGARVRLVGGSSRAAANVGIRPGRVRLQALLLAGAVGTVAVLLAAPMTLLGIPQAAGVSLRAVAAALLARNHPLGALGVGMIFGLAEVLLQSAAPAVGADAAVAIVVLAWLVVRGSDESSAWGRAW